MDDAGALVIDNATARLADEGTQGAKKKATLRGKRGRRAPTRRTAARTSAAEGEGEGDDEWDEDDGADSAAGTPTSASSGFPPVPPAHLSGTPPQSASAVPDVFGGDDIFAGSPAKSTPSASLVFGALDDGPSIF